MKKNILKIALSALLVMVVLVGSTLASWLPRQMCLPIPLQS